MKRSILSPLDLTRPEIDDILSRAGRYKSNGKPIPNRGLRVGALYFNPSLRTRVSFEQAAQIVGGTCQTLNAGADMWKLEMDPLATMDGDSQETAREAARVLGRMFHVLGIRSFPQGRSWQIEKREDLLRDFAAESGSIVVSLEGACHHPCQGLADAMTMRENFNKTENLPVALCWGWHPKSLPMAVPNTFALQAALEGADLRIVRPRGWELDPEVMDQVRDAASVNGGRVCEFEDRAEGLSGAKVVYVKSWGSLSTPGVPAPESLRSWMFDDSACVMTDEAKVMHCLPVRRNVEISSSVLDSNRSLVIDEAENRLWAQAGLLDFLAEELGL